MWIKLKMDRYRLDRAAFQLIYSLCFMKSKNSVYYFFSYSKYFFLSMLIDKCTA